MFNIVAVGDSGWLGEGVFQNDGMIESPFGGKDRIRGFLKVYKRIQAYGTRKGKGGESH